MSLPLTGSQTVGPYFSIGMAGLCSEAVARAGGAETVRIEGKLLDSNGAPIPDGLLEIWQADGEGRYGGSLPAHSGFGRVSTGQDGEFHFVTTRPGAVAYDGERMQAPHLVVLVYMRGLLRNLVTRVYFPDEALNVADPVMQLVPEQRRQTLIARRDADAPGVLRWDIVVRDSVPADGKETVFFAW